MRVKILSRRHINQPGYFTNAQIVQGDLLDRPSLNGFLEPGAVVINMAYMSDVRPEDNVRGMLNLVRACMEVGAAQLVHVSTSVVVGRAAEAIITEQTPCRPVILYEKVKLEMENILLDHMGGECALTIIRPTEVFGEGGKGLVKLADDLVRGSSWVKYLRRSFYHRRRLNLVCVENVVAVIRWLICTEADVDRQCFIVSDDDAEENNFADVSRLLSQYLGVKPTSNAVFECPPLILSAMLRAMGRSNANPYRTYSCSKLMRWGFHKPVSFQDGLKRFADWYKRTRFGYTAA
jgi:nucleoside-diphosphate-sugar epimerase